MCSFSAADTPLVFFFFVGVLEADDEAAGVLLEERPLRREDDAALLPMITAAPYLLRCQRNNQDFALVDESESNGSGSEMNGSAREVAICFGDFATKIEKWGSRKHESAIDRERRQTS